MDYPATCVCGYTYHPKDTQNNYAGIGDEHFDEFVIKESEFCTVHLLVCPKCKTVQMNFMD